MIGGGIINGASVILKRVPDGYEPRPGTIVAAYVEGSGTTLKGLWIIWF
jgi:repressor LexA